KTVVRSHIVDALEGVICVRAAVGKEIIAAVETSHQVRHHSRIAFNKTANIVAKASIPLQPGKPGESLPELESAYIPRLGDQPHLAQLRVSRNLSEDRSVSPVKGSIRVAAEHRCQIKAESVDVHLLLPITQAVHHHLAHVSAAKIQRVARTRIICVRA